MLRFTKRADYGLMAIHYIATHDGLGAVSAKRIAEEFRIPPELLAKILQRLAKGRLRPDAPSRRHLGRRGGSRARGPDQYRELPGRSRVSAGVALQSQAARA